MATEIELKFRIPPARLAALRRAVATTTAQVQPLAAAYFDTPGEHLAAARMALRLRREGDAWVQTLKAEGAGPLQRLEHNAPVDGTDRPTLDIARHDGTAAGSALRRLLADAGQPALQQRYATTVQRTRRLLRSGGALIELALDEGTVQAGPRSLALSEIEFELLGGTPQALLALAGRWASRHGLLLDVRSKSELGHTLAAGLPGSPPTAGRPLRLARQADIDVARSAMLSQALRQVLANASQMAAGPFEPGHLHQLRVGLRRLRGVLGACWPADAVGPAADALQAAAALYRQLGAARDADAMGAWLWHALQAAGAPPLQAGPPPPPSADPAELLRAPAVQQLWMALIGLGLPPAPAQPAATSAAPLSAAAALAGPLGKLWRQVRRDARRFDLLDDAARHRLRRRIKRLRDLSELSAGLWPAKAMAPWLRRLKQAQQHLGDFNDTVVALAHCRGLAAHDPAAWFAVGWLSARHAAGLPGCSASLQRLARGRPPWA
jgi:triphosphatase